MNNKVFYQHPNLMRALGMHETVMEVMVNVLGGGESKVGDVKTCSQTHRVFTEEFQALLCTTFEQICFVIPWSNINLKLI